MKSKFLALFLLLTVFICSFQSFAVDLDIKSSNGLCTLYYGRTTYMAWVGTDPNKSINVMVTYSNGFSSSVVLNETSNYKPSLSFDANGKLFLAWTGTDGRLNFMSSSNGLNFTNKFVHSDTSIGAPCLHKGYGGFTIAWTGSDTQLNVARVVAGYNYYGKYYVVLQNKNTISERSKHGPALNSVSGRYYLSWIGNDYKVNYIMSDDPLLKASIIKKVTLNYYSNNSPSITQRNTAIDDYGVILGWTNTHSNLCTLKLNWDGITSGFKQYTYVSYKSPALTTNFNDNKYYIAWKANSTYISVKPIY